MVIKKIYNVNGKKIQSYKNHVYKKVGLIKSDSINLASRINNLLVWNLLQAVYHVRLSSKYENKKEI